MGDFKTVYKTKTFWAGISAVLAGAAGFFTGTMDPGTAIQTTLTGLIGIFLRSGIIKVENGPRV